MLDRDYQESQYLSPQKLVRPEASIISMATGNSWQSQALFAGIIVLCLAAARIIYNVFTHPLRRFPGPLLSRCTRAYYSYYRATGQLELKTKELHDKYGSTVRIAPDELSFNGGTAWEDIYGHKSKKRHEIRLQKEPFFYLGAVAPNGEKNLGACSDRDHARIRGVLSSAFSERALFDQESMLVGHVNHLVQRLRDLQGRPTDAVRWLHHCTYDMITDLSLGTSANALDCDDWSPQAHLMFEGIKEGIAVIEMLRFMPFKHYMMGLLMAAFGGSRRVAFVSAGEKAQMRMATDNYERPDFMSYILRANESSRELTPAEIKANVALLLDVGSETTASALSACLFYLCKNPTILNKVVALIRGEFKTEADMDSKKLSRLPYLTAVLQESLRMYPPVAGSTPRVTPPQGCTIDRQFVPGNQIVGINQYAICRNERNFAHADKFIPERFLEGDPLFAADSQQTFQPFSCGPQSCLGRK
ncbi:hypothetical protein PG999_001415 [Apiospora kogelbergensis]|uniref:Cytochrome P450 n=1 Tax=Apiospora kogelbergensis TaxID=1337665 RepID=A0AAW0RE81_9PEZI